MSQKTSKRWAKRGSVHIEAGKVSKVVLDYGLINDAKTHRTMTLLFELLRGLGESGASTPTIVTKSRKKGKSTLNKIRVYAGDDEIAVTLVADPKIGNIVGIERIAH